MSQARIVGGDKLKKKLKELLDTKAAYVRAGVLEGAKYPDGTSVAKVASVQEFGGEIDVPEREQELYFKQGKDGSVGNRFVKKKKSNFSQTVRVGAHKITIPARSFMRTAIARHVGEWRDGLAVHLKDKKIEQAMKLLGQQMKSDIVQNIKAIGAAGGNSDSTIAGKGFDKPLTDTGHMGRSIDYEVVPGEPE